MKDPLKPRDKITQKMSRDGLIEVNETKETAERISRREQETDFSKPPEQAAQDTAAQLTPDNPISTPLTPHSTFQKPDTGKTERVMEHIGAAQTRQASKNAVRRAQEEAAANVKTSRLQFTAEELSNPELEAYIRKSQKAADNLDAARAALPKEKVLVKERVFDEAAGKGKTRLHFEEREKPMPNGKHHKTPFSRPAQEAGIFVHNKIHEVEKDNSGVEGAHKTEEVTERGAKYGARKIRESYHRHKLKPYRAAAKAEKAAFKANVEFQYQKLLQENPQLAASNPLSRYWQKQRLRRQYQKRAKEAAKQGAKAAGKTAAATEKLTARAAGFVKRHPVGCLLALACVLVIVLLQSCSSSLVSIGNAGAGALGATTYPSEDEAILGAEAAYAGLEAELQTYLDTYESTHDYDEYHFDLDEIEHDPYVLISLLSALHEGEWTLSQVEGSLQMLFDRQYILTERVEVETRYDSDDEPYSWYICYVTLENKNLSHLPVSLLSEEQMSRYSIYMSTLGNRPDLFPDSPYVDKYITNPPEGYEVPGEYLDDETFAAIFSEAEKYIGYPYVWGGSSPSTSFDCSGYVSWVINHSGWNVGRLGAQGLYNICTPTGSPRPGDLVFFKGTYDTPGVSHCGIYVGDGRMLHCGDPIGYANLNTSYWQSHFYAYGRLP